MPSTRAATHAGDLPRRARPELRPRAILRLLALVLLLPAALFIAAGDLAWPMAWAYLAVFLGLSVVGRILVFARHPGLVSERAGALDHADVPTSDKLLVAVVTLIGPVAVVVVAGLDHRLGWSPPLPPGVAIAAVGVAVACVAVGTWAMWVNPFFSAVVRIQRDRGQTVITTGPYRLVRHPGYASAVVADTVVPLILGSLVAFVPTALVVAALVVRTVVEDRTLRRELEGYADYATRTRYRLLPGVW